MTKLAILALLAQTEAQYGIPKGLLTAVCTVESSLREGVTNERDKGEPSIGLCQLKASTAQYHCNLREGTADRLLRAKDNSQCAALYLRWQFERYHNWDKAIIAYNRGNAKGIRKYNIAKNVYHRKVSRIWLKSIKPYKKLSSAEN